MSQVYPAEKDHIRATAYYKLVGGSLTVQINADRVPYIGVHEERNLGYTVNAALP
jgi:hypothetical protein